jgi:hypothetical protein
MWALILGNSDTQSQQEPSERHQGAYALLVEYWQRSVCGGGGGGG